MEDFIVAMNVKYLSPTPPSVTLINTLNEFYTVENDFITGDLYRNANNHDKLTMLVNHMKLTCKGFSTKKFSLWYDGFVNSEDDNILDEKSRYIAKSIEREGIHAIIINIAVWITDEPLCIIRI